VTSIEETFESSSNAAMPERGASARKVHVASHRDRRARLVRRSLILSDTVAVTASLLISAEVAGAELTVRTLAVVFVLPLWIIGAAACGLYSRDEQRVDHGTVNDVLPVVQFITFAAWLAVVLMWAVRHDLATRGIVTFWASAVLLTLGIRSLARAYVRRRAEFRQRTIIVGAGAVGQLVGRKLVQHPEFGVSLVGFVDAAPMPLRTDLADFPLLGSADDVSEVVREHDIRRVIVAFSNDTHDQQLDLIRELRGLDVQIDVVPRLFEAVGPVVGIHTVEGLPLVGLPAVRGSRAARAAKRLTDIVVASAVLVLTAPLFAWIAWRIKRDSPGPVFFRQERLGEQMQPFTLLKFRTMTVETDDAPHRKYVRAIMDTAEAPAASGLYKLERPDATTKTGQWLRRFSLDELPQFINVLHGDMSLVGPRPCLVYETEFFEPYHFTRFDVPAGVTGLWQVSARARTTFREALDLDVAYARNWSLLLDLKLLVLTPAAVFRGQSATL
jgi:exopolysaccharide biosynthesis polyprenyl glycosylphosphotransferase